MESTTVKGCVPGSKFAVLYSCVKSISLETPPSPKSQLNPKSSFCSSVRPVTTNEIETVGVPSATVGFSGVQVKSAKLFLFVTTSSGVV